METTEKATDQTHKRPKIHVTARVRSVLGTGQDESGQGMRHLCSLWLSVNCFCYSLALPAQRHTRVFFPELARIANEVGPIAAICSVVHRV